MKIPSDAFAQIFSCHLAHTGIFSKIIFQVSFRILDLFLTSGPQDTYSPGLICFSVSPELDIAVTGIPWEMDHLYRLRSCLLPSIGQWVGSVSHHCHPQIYGGPDFPELHYGDHLLDDICPCLNLVICRTRIY